MHNNCSTIRSATPEETIVVFNYFICAWQLILCQYCVRIMISFILVLLFVLSLVHHVLLLLLTLPFSVIGFYSLLVSVYYLSHVVCIGIAMVMSVRPSVCPVSSSDLVYILKCAHCAALQSS